MSLSLQRLTPRLPTRIVLLGGSDLQESIRPGSRASSRTGSVERGADRVRDVNVNAGDRAWVDRQCTPQPIATFQQAIKLMRRSYDPAQPCFRARSAVN